jgi:serine O-acetyltransferase
MGEGARLYQAVTLGDGWVPGQPTIGDHVTIGAGACVFGGVRIGDRVIIGAGVQVTSDLADDTVLLGSGPAKRRRPGTDARLDALAP